MKSDQNKKDNRQKSNIQNSSLLIRDLVKYFSNLATLNKDPRTGNSDLREALQVLNNVLRPHSNKSIKELSNIIEKEFTKSNETSCKSPKATLPENLHILSEQEVDNILMDSKFTKLQLVELGAQRFGISKSRLKSLNKSEVYESIRAALNNERTLGVITQEARRGGGQRSS